MKKVTFEETIENDANIPSVPQVASIDVPSITLSASLDGDDVGGSLRVTANVIVDGRMLVVLDNCLSDYEKPNLDSPPPIARLFVFDFASSQTASQSVLLSEWNLLQYESNYSISIASLAGTDITLSPSLLQTPNPTRIVEVITDWSSSEPEQLSFQLNGRTLLDHPASTMTLSPQSQDILELRRREEAESKSETFSVKSVSSLSTSFLVRSSVLVDIPKPPCVTGISCNLDASFTHFVVSFTGQDLPLSGLYTALLSPSASFEVSFSDRVGTSGPIEGNATNGLLFGTEYTLFSPAIEDDLILLNKTSFSTPDGPTLSDVACSLDSHDTAFVVLTLTGSRMPSSSDYKLTVAENGESTKVALTVSFTSSSEGNGRVEVYKKENTLKYGQSYSVLSLSLGSLLIYIPNLIKFDTPTGPTRIEEATAKLNDARTRVTIELSGMSLIDGIWMITIPTTPPQVIRGELGENGKIVCFVDVDETDNAKLNFGATYELKTVMLNGNEVIVNDDIFFAIPRRCFISTASFSFVNIHHTTCQISFDGIYLPLVGEYIVLLNPHFSFPISFASTSKGKSLTLSIGTTNNLQYSQTYNIKSITKASDQLEEIEFNASIVIETGPKPTWTSITVNEGGSDRTEECGSDEDPCGSVVCGWRAGQRKLGGDGIRIEIKKVVGFGERIRVESERLVIQSATGNRSRLLCVSSVFETSQAKDRKAGIMMIDGGSGRLVVESVEIVGKERGRVGMGVGWVSGGEMEVNSVLMRNVVLGVTLFGGADKHDGIDFSVSELTVENTTTSHALIHFSSFSPSSSFSLSHSSFMTTVRTIASAPSSSSPPNLSLISVLTCQELVSVSDCLFEKSGASLSSSPSTFAGNALRITLSSHVTSKSTVVISSCLFLDCLSFVSGSGTQHISTGTHSARLVLSNNWFQNLLSGEEWPSRKGGIAELDWSRLTSVTTPSSSTCAVGVLVDYGTLRPTIVRRRLMDTDSGRRLPHGVTLPTSLTGCENAYYTPVGMGSGRSENIEFCP
ncbi:hypothetical protein BLNAU_15596 [Blattamonas nauphoetae]|uniref:Uncharacterized protein n=1 Tax=Blattamonas nauphoetae TaxID=2049346 RepID=A0ABQ9XAE8_9EUKA|nr:hypothetical protein BLNAU_15596 [Blattamonas nauphoetae]